MGTFTRSSVYNLVLDLTNPFLVGAAVDMYFAISQYFGGTLNSLISTSRATPPIAYATNLDGTLTGFGPDTPRIGSGTGLLVEEARTNSVLQSDNVATGLPWLNPGGSNEFANANIYISPLGTQTMAQQLAGAGNFNHYMVQSGITTVAAPQTYSGYLRYVNNRWHALAVYDGTTIYGASFDLLNGVVGALSGGVTATITPSITGVYRCTMTVTTLAQVGGGNVYSIQNNTDLAGITTWNAAGTEATGSWGFQFELGSFATSYIPTTTVAVTRAADNVGLTGVAAALLAASAGSGCVSVGPIPPAVIAVGNRIIDSDGNRILLYADSTHLSLFNGTFLNAAIADCTINNTKAAYGWSGAGRSVVGDGGTVATDANTMGAATLFWIGSTNGGNNFYCNYFKRFTIWNSRLSDARLQALTWDPLPGATVDMGFSAGQYFGGTLNSLISTSRATPPIAYATNLDGTLTGFGPDTPRIGVGTGLLVEEARTNYVLSSGSVGNGDWSLGNSIIGPSVVTLNNATAPDGTLTATRMVLPAFSGAVGEASKLYQLAATGASSVATTNSFYLRGAVGGELVDLIAYDGAAYSFTRCTLTTSWQRFSRPFTSVNIAVTFIQLGYDGAANPTAATGGTIYVWGAQMEQTGLFPTSYIPTTGVAVTRARDVVTLTGAGLAVLQSNHSAVAQFNRPSTPYGPIFVATDGTNNNRIDLGAINSNTYFTLIAAGVTKFDGTGPAFTPSTSTKEGYSINSTLFSAAAVGTLFQASIAGALPTITTGYLGDDTFNRSANAYIQRLTLWNSRLSDATLQGFTT